MITTTADGRHVQATEVVFDEIARAITGEVRRDRLSRALYATDASIYEIVPDGVVFPRTAEDVSAAVRICRAHGVAITARGAGTGLAGGAVNGGIQLDLSRFMNRVLAIDAENRTVQVQPGVVLDELNAQLKPHGLQFAPDVATASRANIGGMIGNNSCGAHSVIYGRTCDHVVDLEMVLSDGSQCRWGPGADNADNPLAVQCEAVLRSVSTEEADEIRTRYPTVMRRNAGYALDRLKPTEGRVNVETLICGSEGTLAIITAATLKLVPLPTHKGLVVAHFAELFASLGAAPVILEHQPAAVELLDRLIIEATKRNREMIRRRAFVEGEPDAILICELYDEDAARLKKRLQALADDLASRQMGYAHPVIVDAAGQDDVWMVRKAGLGLLTSVPGDLQTHAFVEDTAVDPSVLRAYIERFDAIMKEEGCQKAGYYAHVSVGVIHVRPMLNLKLEEDVQLMERIADRVSSLVLEYKGIMTGEHGDGIVRSQWLEKTYGPRIMAAFHRIKTAFDPAGILNPGKIVDPLPMTSNLRYGGGFASRDYATHLDFSAHGGIAGLAGMCSGVGQCRQRLVGTMCPSYIATDDEQHTTRARANALRMALSNRDLLDGLDDPALDAVFDLCLSCKACKTECPTGTDVAKLKSEWLAFKNRTHGVPLRSRMIARSVELARWGSALAPVSNWVLQSKWMRAWMDRRYGFDRRVPPPRFARRTFRKWFARRSAPRAVDRPKVVYFVDTWTNHYTPQVGRAAVRVLEALGYEVIVPPTVCCGRPHISKGLLPEARYLAERNVECLGRHADAGVPIIGTEPSCISALTDELPQLVRNPQSRRIGERAVTIESFVAAQLKEVPDALRFRDGCGQPLIYHGHCHQKALFGTADGLGLLRACCGGQASEINSGCCGMAGSFGHETEHYDVAQAVGEQRLFPVVRGRQDAGVAISGFSCRHQLEHHTDAHPRHVIEWVADALADET